MSIDNITEIVNNIPYILEYFIPGFIFIKVFQFLTTRESSSYQIVLSVVISYIMKALCSIFHKYILSDIIFLWNIRILILSTLSIILSVLFTLLIRQKFINSLLSKITHKSLNDDIWQDIIDYKNGTTLRIVCDNEIYTGTLVAHEEKGNDSWFVLSDYIIDECKDGKIITLDSSNYKYESTIAIPINSANRVELYYTEQPIVQK